MPEFGSSCRGHRASKLPADTCSQISLIKGGSFTSLKPLSPNIFSPLEPSCVFADSWCFCPRSLFGASPLDPSQLDREQSPACVREREPQAAPSPAKHEAALGATSSCARDPKVTRGSATSCGLAVCHGKNTLFTMFQAACGASCSSRRQIPALTWLCLFSLALRASLPAALEQLQGVAPGSTHPSALPLHAQGLRQAAVSLPPGEFRASWKIRNMKAGTETQLSIHTLPAASPVRSGDKHTRAGALLARPLAPGPPLAVTNGSERLFKGSRCLQFCPVLPASPPPGRQAAGTTTAPALTALASSGGCIGQKLPRFQAQLVYGMGACLEMFPSTPADTSERLLPRRGGCWLFLHTAAISGRFTLNRRQNRSPQKVTVVCDGGIDPLPPAGTPVQHPLSFRCAAFKNQVAAAHRAARAVPGEALERCRNQTLQGASCLPSSEMETRSQQPRNPSNSSSGIHVGTRALHFHALHGL